MGCDIHLFIEVRDGDAWRFVRPDAERADPVFEEDGEWDMWRNYDLFALLADVRNNEDVEPLCAGRAVPEDASTEYRAVYDDWGGDAHSATWATAAELLRHQDALEQAEEDFAALVRHAVGLGPGADSVRLLFFFDN